MRLLLPTALAAAITVIASLAGLEPTEAATRNAAGITTIPGTDVSLPAVASAEANRPPDDSLVNAIATWLTTEFDLPPTRLHPDIAFASEDELATIWFGGLESDELAGNTSKISRPEIVALYDLKTQTIFLPYGWQASSPVDLSVLVHEMVHHLQATGNQTFRCPQEREQLAYDAQDKWLTMFGTSLEVEFEVDAFSLLIRTQCLE